MRSHSVSKRRESPLHGIPAEWRKSMLAEGPLPLFWSRYDWVASREDGEKKWRRAVKFQGVLMPRGAENWKESLKLTSVVSEDV